MEKQLSAKELAQLCKVQVNELTDQAIYTKMANRAKDPHNKQILLQIAADEAQHVATWESYTGKKLKAKAFTVAWHVFLSFLLGFTFVLKKMENQENKANARYAKQFSEFPEAKQLAEDESTHEAQLIDMLDEERLQYVGAMILGINDALVEISGTLAGLTLALQNTRVIALAGLITGISATLSMAASEYLSAKNDGHHDAKKASVYTGVAYFFSVVFMVLPYLLLPSTHYMAAMFIMLGVVLLIIFGFTYYISVAKGVSFKRRFAEMAILSLSVAALSFVIGIVVKKVLGVSI